LEYVKHETDVWLEITTLLIPGQNDSDGELDALSAWVADHLGPDVPLHFTAFHPDYRMRDLPPTPITTLKRAREIARARGIHHVYTGNVHDPEGQSTWCHDCGALLIERDGYELGAWNLTPVGACRSCGARCAGVFEASCGHWGARRVPVRLAQFA
jgi:pyruvate formate lyase activating enzyme